MLRLWGNSPYHALLGKVQLTPFLLRVMQQYLPELEIYLAFDPVIFLCVCVCVCK